MGQPLVVSNRTRYNFGRIKEVLDIPNLIEIQHSSYHWFLEEGLREIFQEISPIQDFTGNLILSLSITILVNRSILWKNARSGCHLCGPLRVRVRLINKETGEVKEQEVFMGDFPR